MAIETVPQPTDIHPTDEWRINLVELPADHVYGATALDDISWQALDEKPHGVFLVEERPANWRPKAGEESPKCRCWRCPDHRSAWALVHERIEKADRRAFDPYDGPIRIVVTEVFR